MTGSPRIISASVAGSVSVIGQTVDGLPAPHHCDGIGDCHDFIEFVCDDNNALAFVFEAAHTIEKSFDLLRGKHGCRFIHDEDVRTVIENFQNFGMLLGTNRQRFNGCVQRHIESELRSEFSNPFFCLLVIEECAEFCGVLSQGRCSGVL